MDEAFKILAALVLPLMGAVGYLYRSGLKREERYNRQLDELREENAALRRKQTRSEIDLARTHSWIESRYGDDFGDAVIVVDADSGLITEWNPSATVLFHWNQRESLGKSLTKMIPERYMEQHNKAWSDWKATGHPPRRGPFHVHAKAKDGSEFPISLYLSGWYDGGKRVVAANIRKREEVA